MEDILKTCLHQKHLDLGAKMMPFGGFDMPIEYTTIIFSPTIFEMPKSVKSFTA